MEQKKNYNINTILAMQPEALAIWLDKNFLDTIPTGIETTDDLRRAGELLGKLANIYSYIMSITTFAKLAVREAKRRGDSKDDINDCIARRDVLDSFTEVIKTQYNAVSRMITVKKQVDEEIKMV